MRRFLKYFESIEAFNDKKRSVGPSNNEYIDLDGYTVYGPDDIEILWDDICFIEASNSNPLPRIYTHGAYYTGETLPLETAYTSYTHGFADALDVSYAVKSKQDILISGTNIKTVSYISLLGEGNIEFPSYNGDGNTIAIGENNVVYALMDQTYGVASYSSYSTLSYNFTYFADYIDNKTSDINDKFDAEILDINRSVDDLSYVFSTVTTNHEIRIENLENASGGHEYSYAAYINISPSYVISTTYTTLQAAFTTGIDGLATAYDVACVIADNEEVVSYALAYQDERLTNVEGNIQSKQDILSYASYIDITNNVVTATYTTLQAAFTTGIDGLATALDTANELVKVENTIAVPLNNHESRLNIIEDTNIVDGNFKLGDTIYLSCAYVNGDTIVCDKHVTYNEETETIIVNS